MSSLVDPDKPRLEVYIDFICPWCYLAHGVMGKLRERHAVDVQWLPFPLHPDTPAEGMLISDLLRGANVDAMHERLYAMMDELDLPYTKTRDHLFNTRKAQELALWAAGQHGGEKLIGELFRSYFVDNQNLAEDAVLLAAVTRAGLEEEAAREVLDDESFAEDVDAAWQRAGQYQLNGVPAFVGGGYQFSGYQPLQEMERFLELIKSGKES
jgi:predicted DsbA family dithiol-disulfide isomerase